MLQVDVCPFASDALEDAMRLAQTKSLNSYTFSDCINFLNYVWSDIYSQICMIDSGYYSKTVQLTEKLTKIPKFVKNTILIYAAQSQTDYNRIIYRQSGQTDQIAQGTYRISGTDLWCPDATRTRIYLEYCPQPSQIFFTHHNRDPKIYPDGHDTKRSDDYNLWKLIGIAYMPIDDPADEPKANGYYEYNADYKEYVLTNDNTKIEGKTYYEIEEIDVSDNEVTSDDIARADQWLFRHKNKIADIEDNDITVDIIKEENEDGKWELRYISCDYPYIFCSYKHNVTGEWKSGFFDKKMEWTDYNPFEWTGRNDNVEYLECHWNDKTGLGVIVRDWNDFDKTLLNIDKLPEIAGAVIFVLNSFEYKATDGVAYKFSQGYWYNRYNTDFNYEKVPEIEEDPDNPGQPLFPEDPDHNDVVNFNGKLYKFDTDTDEWNDVDAGSIIRVAQEESNPRVKELGWTPDTKLVYPAPEVYRYLVARLAEKFSALNESNIMGVQSELADARFAFQAFLKKDKSAWERMINVNPATIGDWL